jgi:hypothetical protein
MPTDAVQPRPDAVRAQRDFENGALAPLGA